jgi:FkbM family methyltransferase
MAAEFGPEPVVVDLGANAGYFSLWLLAHVPAARVYAYEPLPGNLAILERNRAQNPKATARLNVIAKAVTGTPVESVEFHVQAANDLSMSASIIRESITKSARSVRVAATTLSAIMDENSLTKIDLLKIDCEGAEYEILFRTPADRFTRIQRIALETHVRPELGWDHAAAVKFLRDQGYVVRELVQHIGRSHLIWAQRKTPRP